MTFSERYFIMGVISAKHIHMREIEEEHWRNCDCIIVNVAYAHKHIYSTRKMKIGKNIEGNIFLFTIQCHELIESISP